MVADRAHSTADRHYVAEYLFRWRGLSDVRLLGWEAPQLRQCAMRDSLVRFRGLSILPDNRARSGFLA